MQPVSAMRTAPAAMFLCLAVCCASRAAEPEKAADAAQWKSLFDGRSLKGWKASDFPGHNHVEVKDGTIVMLAGSQMTGITWTGECPKINYEIALDARRVDGSDFFCGLTFPFGDSPCSLIVGGWGGGVVGLSSINGSDASENETSQYLEFKTGQWYRVRLRVSDAKIEAWIDGKKLVDVPSEDRTFSIRPEVMLSKPLGFSCYETTAALRDIKLRRLGPADLKGGQKSGK
jgi:hypothetical protein